MKYFYLIALVISFYSCSSEHTKDQAAIENVITTYCNATNDREADLIPELLYPDVFSEDMTEASVVEMFYKQLNATEKFEITDLKFEEPAILLEDTLNTAVYCQKYFSKITIAIDKSSPKDLFDMLAEEARNSDDSAEIDEENYSLTYNDKKKIIVIEEDGKYFLLPDAFFIQLETESFDAQKVFNKYITA